MKLTNSYRYRIHFYYAVLLLLNNSLIFNIVVIDSLTNIKSIRCYRKFDRMSSLFYKFLENRYFAELSKVSSLFIY